MTLTQKVNGVRKMIPTPHHKTAYKTKGSEQSWYDRHEKLFTELAEEIGFEVAQTNRYVNDEKVVLVLRKSGFGDFTLTLTWDQNGESFIRLYGNCTDRRSTLRKRGWKKPRSHNDAHLGNWFLKLVRLDWIADNRPNKSEIKYGDEIVFSGTPGGGGQRTRAKIRGFGGSWGRNYYKVELLVVRGVKNITPGGRVMDVHYNCNIHHESKS